MKIFSSILAVALMATMASAMSFRWNVSGALTFEGQNVVTSGLYDSEKKNVTGQLVYLGTDGVWNILTDGSTSDEKVGEVYNPLVTPALVAGRLNNKTFEKLMADTFADGNSVTADTVFGVLLTYTAADGTVYYNYSSNTYSPTGLVNDASVVPDASFTFNWEMDESGGDTPTAGGGWWTIPIPEPMTVLCGLAGLALLLKRRA